MSNNIKDLQIATITLRNLSGVSELTLREIVRTRGTLDGVLDMPFEELVHMGFDLAAAGAVVDADTSFAENELKEMEKIGGKLLLMESGEYPAALKETYDPPLFLYTLGNTECMNEMCIALVGARKVSRNGEDVAFKLANGLAGCGFTIISGLAYGVDLSAHLGALDADGATAAVLGSGLKNIYPKQHIKYIDRICRKGCVVSEYSLDEEPNNYNFPKRNRIISGLSLGVVIVEASKRSGSLITGRLALEQGRDLFAVPVSPLAANNATNGLIRNGAILTESHIDIIQEYSHLVQFGQIKENEKKAVFDTPEKENVWNEISIEPLTVDELVMRTGIDYPKLTAVLFSMELEGHIKKTNDGRYAAT